MSEAEAGCGAVSTLRAWPVADAGIGLEIEGAFGRTWILLPREDAERLMRCLSAADTPGETEFSTYTPGATECFAYGSSAGHAVRCGPVAARTFAAPAPVRAIRAADAAVPAGSDDLADADIEAAIAELFGRAEALDEGGAAPPRRPRPIEMGAWDVPDDIPAWGAGELVAVAVAAGWALAFVCLGFDSGAAWALAFGGAVVGSAAWIFARMEG